MPAPPDSAHDVGLNVPAAPLRLQLTVPLGVPLLLASVTVAVQSAPVLTATGSGAHPTPVPLARFTVSVVDPLDVECWLSPP